MNRTTIRRVVAAATALLTHFGFGPIAVTTGGLAAGFGLRAGSMLLRWSFPSLPGADDSQ